MREVNRPYRPLGIDPWAGQYQQGVEEISHIENDPIFEYSEYDGANVDRYRDVAVWALFNELAYRTSRNQRTHLEIDYDNQEQRCRFETGDITPSEGLNLLHKHPEVGSIELARHRHVGDWTGPDRIVAAVKADLSADEGIDKNSVDISTTSPSYYRITSFDVADPKVQQAIAVTRKREVFTHYDESIVSVLAETYALDITSGSFGDDIKERVIEEFVNLEQMRKTNPSEVDEWMVSHHNFVGVAINSIAKIRHSQKTSGNLGDALNINGAIPLTSAVYAASREKRRSYQDRLAD